MPHPLQKNPEIKKFIITLESMPWNEKIDTYWSLGIRVHMQQQRSLITTMKNIVDKLFAMIKITSHQTQKHNNLLFHCYMIHQIKIIKKYW
jgi:hypothetical protein